MISVVIHYPSRMHAILFLAALDIFTVRTFHQVAISPNGKRVAWAERDHGITVADLSGANRKQLTTGDDEGLAWSPDSAKLAYLASKEKRGQRQLIVDGNPLTGVKGYLAEPQWSPDG